MTANNAAMVVMIRVGWLMIRIFIIYLSFVAFWTWAMPLSLKIIGRFYAASICSRRIACRPKFGDVFSLRLKFARRSWVSPAE